MYRLRRLKAMGGHRRTSSISPTPPIAGVGRIAIAVGLVVKRDIARHDGEVERAAGFAHAVDGLDDLAHDLGLLRIAEIQTIGDAPGACADRSDVAPGFGDRLLAALIGSALQ